MPDGLDDTSRQAEENETHCRKITFKEFSQFFGKTLDSETLAHLVIELRKVAEAKYDIGSNKCIHYAIRAYNILAHALASDRYQVAREVIYPDGREEDPILRSLSHTMVVIKDLEMGRCLLIEPQNELGKSYILSSDKYVCDAILLHLEDNGLAGFQYELQLSWFTGPVDSALLSLISGGQDN